MVPQTWTVEDHLAGQPEVSVAMYRRFVELVADNGPYICTVGKTMIGFKGSRRGFAGAKPTPRGLTGFLDLQRTVDDRRIISVAPYTRRLFVHQFRITDLADLDESFADLISEAYAVGQGAHMKR
jgi:Domain of unknown function (DUF5655)